MGIVEGLSGAILPIINAPETTGFRLLPGTAYDQAGRSTEFNGGVAPTPINLTYAGYTPIAAITGLVGDGADLSPAANLARWVSVYIMSARNLTDERTSAGRSYRFKHDRIVFVDIPRDMNNPPNKIGPMIIDKRGGPGESARYVKYPVSETGAFILHFLLKGVDPADIRPIYMKEYGADPTASTNDINRLINILTRPVGGQPALKESYTKIPRPKPDSPGVNDPLKFDKKLVIGLDVGMNQVGGGGFTWPPW